MSANIVLLLNVASTWAMVGLIWLIQVVHYPLFAQVGEENFVRYSEDHQRLITLIVLPLMVCELITSFWLRTNRPQAVPDNFVIAGIVLVVVIWLSTFFIQVPQHGRLATAFDLGTIQLLVRGNWIRTVAWSLRGVLSLYMTYRVLEA